MQSLPESQPDRIRALRCTGRRPRSLPLTCWPPSPVRPLPAVHRQQTGTQVHRGRSPERCGRNSDTQDPARHHRYVCTRGRSRESLLSCTGAPPRTAPCAGRRSCSPLGAWCFLREAFRRIASRHLSLPSSQSFHCRSLAVRKPPLRQGLPGAGCKVGRRFRSASAPRLAFFGQAQRTAPPAELVAVARVHARSA